MDRRGEFALRAISVIANRVGLYQLAGIAGTFADLAEAGQNVDDHMADVSKALKTGEQVDLDKSITNIANESAALQGRDTTPARDRSEMTEDEKKDERKAAEKLAEQQERDRNIRLAGGKTESDKARDEQKPSPTAPATDPADGTKKAMQESVTEKNSVPNHEQVTPAQKPQPSPQSAPALPGAGGVPGQGENTGTKK